MYIKEKMTDYRQKYENERTARKLAEKECELLKREIELLKMELKQAGRHRSSQVSKENTTSESDMSSHSSSSESEDEAPKPTHSHRKKPQTSKSSHEVIIKPVKNTLAQVIYDVIDEMSVFDYSKYADAMEVNSTYEINLFDSIINNISTKQVPILMSADGKYSVYDEEKGERKWVVCDLNRLVDKTYGRIHNRILKKFNEKAKINKFEGCETENTLTKEDEFLLTLNMLCKIDTEKLLKPRTRALTKMFKN
jgi:hypothetical protein